MNGPTRRTINVAEWAQLRLQRKQYASLRPRSADAAKLIITKYIIPDQEKFLTTLQSHPDDVRTLLQQTRESIVVKPGETVTDRMVCATYVVDQVYSVLQNLAVGALNSDNLYSFLLYFDVADGVMEAVVRIYTGEAELNGETADRLAQLNHSRFPNLSSPERSLGGKSTKKSLVLREMSMISSFN